MLQIIFGMYFQPAHGGPARQKIAVVRGTQAERRQALEVG